jgi:hypothetical protein
MKSTIRAFYEKKYTLSSTLKRRRARSNCVHLWMTENDTLPKRAIRGAFNVALTNLGVLYVRTLRKNRKAVDVVSVRK